MANDWIKVRENIHEDPAILYVARKMKVRPEVVVGFCVRFWGWVSRSTANGVVANLSLDDVEQVLNMPHFLHHLCDAGWLEYVESTEGSAIIIPNFDRHMSDTAKQRAIKTQQKQAQRAQQWAIETPQRDVAKNRRHSGDTSATREEKRREEDKEEGVAPSPPNMGMAERRAAYKPEELELPIPTAAFSEAWLMWCEHRLEIKKPLTPTSCKQQLTVLAQWGERRAITAIQYTITKGWQGIREPEGSDAPPARVDRSARMKKRAEQAAGNSAWKAAREQVIRSNTGDG